MSVECYSNVVEETLLVGSKLVDANKQRLVYLMIIEEKNFVKKLRKVYRKEII
jgi:hypothetical protein